MPDVRTIHFTILLQYQFYPFYKANQLKDQGNKAFAAKDYDKAIDLFSQAIAIDPQNHVLYSNRSAANAGKKLWDLALEDAEQVKHSHSSSTFHLNTFFQCIKVNPSWSKGYARKGAALHGARRWDDAIAAYQAGLKLEDSPALRKGLKEVQDAQGSFLYTDLIRLSFPPQLAESKEEFGLGKMFTDPNLLGKLAANPRTQKHLADSAFVQKVIHLPY